MSGRRTFPTVPDLLRVPVGDRAPLLRRMIAFRLSWIKGAAPAVQARHRTYIRRVAQLGRLIGIRDLIEA